MATNQYITGRKQYSRPQAIAFSENSGVSSFGMHVPVGYEIGSDTTGIEDENLLNQFIILSDDNRAPIDFKMIRIERRERMVNGRMRSYHIADKRTFSVSWNMLPSRAFSEKANFSTSGASSLVTSSSRGPGTDGSFSILPNQLIESQQYTTDGGAGGVEILDWYKNHVGSFWVFLAYDNYKELGLQDPSESANSLARFNEVIEMYITDFSYSVEKRGGTNFDFWNINITLEEV